MSQQHELQSQSATLSTTLSIQFHAVFFLQSDLIVCFLLAPVLPHLHYVVHEGVLTSCDWLSPRPPCGNFSALMQQMVCFFRSTTLGKGPL